MDVIDVKQVVIHGIYRHFKGDYYIVEGIAKNADDLRLCVVYRALYGESTLWVRPLDDFLGLVDRKKYPKVEQAEKFELQKIASKRKK